MFSSNSANRFHEVHEEGADKTQKAHHAPSPSSTSCGKLAPSPAPSTLATPIVPAVGVLPTSARHSVGRPSPSRQADSSKTANSQGNKENSSRSNPARRNLLSSSSSLTSRWPLNAHSLLRRRLVNAHPLLPPTTSTPPPSGTPKGKAKRRRDSSPSPQSPGPPGKRQKTSVLPASGDSASGGQDGGVGDGPNDEPPSGIVADPPGGPTIASAGCADAGDPAPMPDPGEEKEGDHGVPKLLGGCYHDMSMQQASANPTVEDGDAPYAVIEADREMTKANSDYPRMGPFPRGR